MKRNDGLSHKTDMFNEYMRDVFQQVTRTGGETTVSVLARNLNVLGLVTLRQMLVDLVQRCHGSPFGRAAILNKGGGSAGTITLQHLPYLASHVTHLDNVIVKVREAIAARRPRPN